MKNIIEEKTKKISEELKNFVENNTNPGILGGIEGQVLFLSYYSKYNNDNSFNEIATKKLEDLFELINSYNTVPANYSGGLAGLGWVLLHLSKQGFIDLDEDTMLGFDNYVYEEMIQHLEKGQYDFLHSGLGIAFYYLERGNTACDQKVAEAIKLIDKMKHIDNNGTYKWCCPVINPDGTFSDKFNISLSHGMSSIISILAMALKRNIETELTNDLLDGAISYILNQEMNFEEIGSCFPGTSLESLGEGKSPSRLGWCYGDLGVAVALYNVSKLLENKNLEQKAIEVLLKNTERRDLRKGGIGDAGLCHGSAGVGHIFNRMYINTGILEFKEAADYWFEKTLEFAKWEDGPAGYKKRTFDEGKEGFESSYGFLEGIAGIGLAMISYDSNIEPAWDRALLIS